MSDTVDGRRAGLGSAFMKIWPGPITAAAAAAILADPCAVHAAEIKVPPAVQPHEVADFIDRHLSADTGTGVLVMADQEPTAFIFHWRKSPGLRRLIFVARERYFQLGVQGIKRSRDYLRELARSYPDDTIEAINAAKHPDVPRWLAAIGFVDQGADGAGVHRLVLKGA